MSTEYRTVDGETRRICECGGYMRASWNDDGDSSWECNNCYAEIKRMTFKPSGKVTPSQQRQIDKVLKAYGGKVTKQEFIGRVLWVMIENEDRRWFEGNTLFGTIGPMGGLKLHHHPIGAKDTIIRTDIDIDVFLTKFIPQEQTHEQSTNTNQSRGQDGSG